MIIKNNLFNISDDEAVEDRYTTKVGVPQYLPSIEKPSLYSLFNSKKYEELVKEINNSTVSEEEKEFLRLAASRHIVFNYSKIADYYSHSSKEVQELMEKSALVLIDIDDAIVNGYVKLDKTLTKLAESAYLSRLEKKGI